MFNDICDINIHNIKHGLITYVGICFVIFVCLFVCSGPNESYTVCPSEIGACNIELTK
jgi:hypothetical protein